MRPRNNPTSRVPSFVWRGSKSQREVTFNGFKPLGKNVSLNAHLQGTIKASAYVSFTDHEEVAIGYAGLTHYNAGTLYLAQRPDKFVRVSRLPKRFFSKDAVPYAYADNEIAAYGEVSTQNIHSAIYRVGNNEFRFIRNEQFVPNNYAIEILSADEQEHKILESMLREDYLLEPDERCHTLTEVEEIRAEIEKEHKPLTRLNTSDFIIRRTLRGYNPSQAVTASARAFHGHVEKAAGVQEVRKVYPAVVAPNMTFFGTLKTNARIVEANEMIIEVTSHLNKMFNLP